MTTAITSKEFPKIFKVYTFSEGADTRDLFTAKYAIEYTVNSAREEDKFYNSLNHEATFKCERIK